MKLAVGGIGLGRSIIAPRGWENRNKENESNGGRRRSMGDVFVGSDHHVG